MSEGEKVLGVVPFCYHAALRWREIRPLVWFRSFRGLLLILCLGASRRLIPVIPFSGETARTEDDIVSRLEGRKGVGVESGQNIRASSSADSATGLNYHGETEEE